MGRSENGRDRSLLVPSPFLLLLVAAAAFLLVDDIRLRRRAAEGSAGTNGTTLTVPLDEPETPSEPEHPSLLSDYEIRLLHEQGLEDPERELVADLRSRPELIPFDGVLGGTMGFYNAKSIFLLPHNHVFAYYSDGHLAGHMLLRYEVENGRIDWTVLYPSPE